MVQKMQKCLILAFTFFFILANLSQTTADESIQWHHYTSDPVNAIAVGDISGDSNLDIVLAIDNYIFVLDSSGEEILRIRTSNFINSLSVGDISGDGRNDIAAGLVNYGVEVFSPTGEKLWEYRTHSTVQNIIIKDIDLGGHNELIIVSHNNTFANNAWVILNHLGCVRFQSKDFPFIEIESNNYGGSFTKRWEADNQLRFFIAEDITGNGYTEFIASTRLNDIIVFDYNMNQLWGYNFDSPITSLSIGDLENDGFKEILLGVNKKLIIFTKDGFPLKEYSFDQYVNAAAVFKEEPNESFVLVGTGNTLYAYDWNEKIFSHRFDQSINLIRYDNLDYKDGMEIIIGTRDGAFVLNTSGEILFTYRTYSPVSEIFSVNLKSKGEKELIIASSNVNVLTYKSLKESRILPNNTNQQQTQETISRANSIFNAGMSLYSVQEYREALDRFREARALYQSVSHNEGINNTDTYISNSNLYIQAESLENQAISLLNENKYEEAKLIYQDAKNIYLTINDTVKIKEVDQKIQEIDDSISGQFIYRVFLYILIGGVLGISGVTLFFITKRKKSK